MTQPQYQVYDFASSARVERPLWLAVNRWMLKHAELFCEHWANFSQSPISASPLSIDAHDYETNQSRWDQPTFAAPLKFAGTDVEGMVVANRFQLLGLLMDILGNTDELVDRELTSIESSLCEMLIEQAATTLVESWNGAEPLNVIVGELSCQANRTKLFPVDRVLLNCGIGLKLGDEGLLVELEFLFSKDELSDLLKIEKRSDKQFNPNAKLSPEKIAEVSVVLAAKLGRTEIPVDQLMSLSEGDVIVLNQSVVKPIELLVDGQPTFLAWPGQVGEFQAIHVVERLH